MKAGIGAVLVDLAGTIARFISASMKDEIVAAIKKSQRKTIISELELFTILCAVVVWKQFIAGCAAVVYTDHDTVRDCLISCTYPGPVPEVGTRILFQCLDVSGPYRPKYS